MKCARVHLQERPKVKMKPEAPVLNEKPRRFCQKRLVNPGHEEGHQRLDIWERLHCNKSSARFGETADGIELKHVTEDLVLTVQTLKFEGDGVEIEQIKRPRTSFKYKTFAGGHKHRMFVKQAVAENEYNDDGRSSEMTYYYIEDYLKYLNYSDKSRPMSGKSSIFKRSVRYNNEDNKDTNVRIIHQEEKKRFLKFEPKIKTLPKKNVQSNVKEELRDVSEINEDTRIAYQKTAKRKSLTISRIQSPETVHIIRVDVVCNHPNKSALSDYEDIQKGENSPKLENFNVKNNLFANKYLLSNSVKTLEERISGGSKFTLLCKTFKLSDRSPKKYVKSHGSSKKIVV